MKDIVYWPSAEQRKRLVTSYVGGPNALQPRPDPDSMSGPEYFSGSGGLGSTTDPVARHSMVSQGSFGWSGFYGSYFWADPEKNLAAVLMVQTFNRDAWYDFETAVMQAVID